MNLNNLKPAWRQFQVFNSLQAVGQEEILSIIEGAEHQPVSRLHGVVTSTLMFILLVVCCHGG